MGKIKQGILGGFNGTTGSVVGASWKGIAYMRGKAQSIKNPRTELQTENRGNFGFISDLMSRSLLAVNDGFKGVSVKKSPFNAAVQTNMKSMVNNQGVVVLANAQFSYGKLLPPQGGTLSLTGNVLTAELDSVGATFEGTKVKLVCVCADAERKPKLVLMKSADVDPNESNISISVTIPDSLAFDSAFVFAFCYDDVTKDASPTLFVGEQSA